MINPLITVLSVPEILRSTPVAPAVQPPAAAPTLPVDGEAFICPVTKGEALVYGLIVEHEPGYENHWWGCWSCASLYWTPSMSMPIQKAWHCVRIAVTPEPTPADWLAQLITEFVAMRDVAEAALADMPPDPDYHTHVDELIAQCRAVVQDLRDREAVRRPRAITVHP